MSVNGLPSKNLVGDQRSRCEVQDRCLETDSSASYKELLNHSKSHLARIFHTDRDEEAAKADGAPPAVGRPRGDCQRLPLGSPERARRAGASESTQKHILMQGCMSPYCPRKTSSSTQHPAGLPTSAGDRYEISGLASSLPSEVEFRNRSHHFFQNLESFLKLEIAPIANRLDHEEDLFRHFYGRLVELGCLKLLIPAHLGGFGGERRHWIEYNVLMSQYSGALLFLQAQHQFSIAQLNKLLPDPKVESLLQSLVLKNQGIGLALQKNKELLRVEKVPQGYRLSGTFLWTTGFSFFSHLLVSFEYEGILFYTLLPLEPLEMEEGRITLSPKIETIVFNAVPSHSITLNQWLIKENDFLARHRVEPKKISEHPSMYNFAGISKALLKVILQGQYGSTPQVLEKYASLEERSNHYHQRVIEGVHHPLTLRSEGLQLAEECALLARLSCGAASILKEHPLNRLIQEMWQYTVAGYSEDQRKAYWEMFK